MSNRLAALLSAWRENKDSCQWVLATIIETQRSSYRKAGAMMFINSLGKSYGLLSGGCLEADLMRQAQKCWFHNKNITVCYDMQDESDIAWQLGIGCGGMVKVLIQPINSDNDYHNLLNLKAHIDNRKSCYYHINLDNSLSVNHITTQNHDIEHCVAHDKKSDDTLTIMVKPVPALIIFGGGIDAQPLIALAQTLGWHNTLIDSRTSYARPAYFKQANVIINSDYSQFSGNEAIGLPQADAIVIMHHNIELDAQALSLIKQQPNLVCAKYIGLLGPQHRTDKVFAAAQLSSNELPVTLANPIGLDLGGDLPESIALSILAQAHAAVENSSAQALGIYRDSASQHSSSSKRLHPTIELIAHTKSDIANVS